MEAHLAKVVSHRCITEMQHEITRATRKPFVTLDFDATSCYDRIIESVASLAARSFGQHKSLCVLHVQHLQEAKYLLKTQLGISDKHFQHCELFLIYGTGQCSTNSPVIWCLISCRLFEAHDAYTAMEQPLAHQMANTRSMSI